MTVSWSLTSPFSTNMAISETNINDKVMAGSMVLVSFIWVGQSKVKQILGRPTGVVYVGITAMTSAVWVGQERVWVGHGLPGLIARTTSE